MLVSNYLRAMGDSFAGNLRKLGVPCSLVDGWHETWAIMTADSDEPGADVRKVGLRQIELLTTAQDLVRNHGQ